MGLGRVTSGALPPLAACVRHVQPHEAHRTRSTIPCGESNPNLPSNTTPQNDAIPSPSPTSKPRRRPSPLVGVRLDHQPVVHDGPVPLLVLGRVVGVHRVGHVGGQHKGARDGGGEQVVRRARAGCGRDRSGRGQRARNAPDSLGHDW
eukprot:scaffold8477_cov112-Isochrysis_galbana.AAC.6